MKNHFRATNILLPQNCSYEKWAVIACDQFTSQPEYWKNVKDFVGDAPSTLNLFFPEAELASVTPEVLAAYAKNMRNYIAGDLFKTYANSYIYVERTLLSGAIRQGVIGIIDLEYYDYAPKHNTKIYATEATVLQRVPPRIALRNQACFGISHTVMFCDDPNATLIEPVGECRNNLEMVYDFDLMFGGGHIRGYLLDGDTAQKFEAAVAAYEAENPYLIGDGNHSLVTAKLTYQAMKEENPDLDWENHPARYAMVELENIHSKAMVFEPIYRIAKCSDAEQMIQELQKLDTLNGTAITWIFGDREGTVNLALRENELPIEALQNFLDRWFEGYEGTVDYIHGADTVRLLAKQPDTVGFLLPDIDKRLLAPYILSGKVMPKKTFSIGHAQEKRYYLEGRLIR